MQESIDFTIVALDMAFAHTGWCILRHEKPHLWGVIDTDSDDDDITRVHTIMNGLDDVFEQVRALWPGPESPIERAIGIPEPRPIFVAEKTDWHQAGRRGQARERISQESLAKGLTTLYAWSIWRQVEVHTIGVMEWRNQYVPAWQRNTRRHQTGAKVEVAKVLGMEFPNLFEYKNWRNPRKRKFQYEDRLFDRSENVALPDHVTDAMGLGLVFARNYAAEVKAILSQKEL